MKKSSSGRQGERRARGSKVTVEGALKWIFLLVLATYVLTTAFVVSRSGGGEQGTPQEDTGAAAGADYDLEGLLLEGLPSSPRHPPAGTISADEERAREDAQLLAEAQRLLGREARGSLRGSAGSAIARH